MSFTVSLRSESKVTYTTLEWTFTIMCSEMSNQCTLVSTGITTQATLVWRQA